MRVTKLTKDSLKTRQRRVQDTLRRETCTETEGRTIFFNNTKKLRIGGEKKVSVGLSETNTFLFVWPNHNEMKAVVVTFI